MLLPQGSILSNWILATLSSRGISSLVPLSDASDATESSESPAHQLERLRYLCRKLGAGDADWFFRDVLAHHHRRKAA